MSEVARVPLSDEELDGAERLALIRADPAPDIPHEIVRAGMLAEIEELERQLTAIVRPAA